MRKEKKNWKGEGGSWSISGGKGEKLPIWDSMKLPTPNIGLVGGKMKKEQKYERVRGKEGGRLREEEGISKKRRGQTIHSAAPIGHLPITPRRRSARLGSADLLDKVLEGHRCAKDRGKRGWSPSLKKGEEGESSRLKGLKASPSRSRERKREFGKD